MHCHHILCSGSWNARMLWHTAADTQVIQMITDPGGKEKFICEHLCHLWLIFTRLIAFPQLKTNI